jgi:hypothetical protein
MSSQNEPKAVQYLAYTKVFWAVFIGTWEPETPRYNSASVLDSTATWSTTQPGRGGSDGGCAAIGDVGRPDVDDGLDEGMGRSGTSPSTPGRYNLKASWAGEIWRLNFSGRRESAYFTRHFFQLLGRFSPIWVDFVNFRQPFFPFSLFKDF